MKRAAMWWLIFGLATLIVTGIIGDAIFDPQAMRFSFRVLSNYFAAVAMFIVAGVCWNKT